MNEKLTKNTSNPKFMSKKSFSTSESLVELSQSQTFTQIVLIITMFEAKLFFWRMLIVCAQSQHPGILLQPELI